MARRRVLIVDDDQRICALIKRVADGLDFEALSIDDPVVFDSTYGEFRPDVIFLDLQMSSADGIELLRFLAERRAGASIILASGLDGRVIETTRALGASLGLNMDEPLRKPFEITDVKARLARHIRMEQGGGREEPIDAAALGRALDQDELALCYQPLVDISTRAVSGVEALMRWHHPEHGLVLPGQFIGLAEDAGLIKALTLWALERGVTDHARWSTIAPDLDLSINLSPSLLDDLDLPDRIEEILREHRFAPRRLILEVTEDRQIRQLTNAMDVLTRLRLKGFRLALDDFGTGYSSLDHLYRLPYGELKIDKTFVTNAPRDENAAMIVRVALELARSVGLRAVAEGVEDAETLAWLEEAGCDIAQGLYLAPPLEASRLIVWLKSWYRRRTLAAVG